MTRLALVALAAVAVLAQDLSGPVVRVIDGDTIEVELAGEVERVRYIGIDTPEMNDRRRPGSEAKRTPGRIERTKGNPPTRRAASRPSRRPRTSGRR